MQSDRRSNLPASLELPRQIYRVIVGLAGWLVLSVWGFIGTGYSALALSVVSLFVAIAVGLPLVLALIARRHRPRGNHAEADTLAEWLGREFEAHTGRVKGTAAVIQVLLPLAAVAVGMSIFAVVHHLDVGA
jgi:Na+/proline symporter